MKRRWNGIVEINATHQSSSDILINNIVIGLELLSDQNPIDVLLTKSSE